MLCLFGYNNALVYSKKHELEIATDQAAIYKIRLKLTL